MSYVPSWSILALIAVGMVVATAAAFIPLLVILGLDSNVTWTFDDGGLHYQLTSLVRRASRLYAYDDMAAATVAFTPGSGTPYALTLTLKNGEKVHVGARWEESDMDDIRRLISRHIPKADMPMPEPKQFLISEEDDF